MSKTGWIAVVLILAAVLLVVITAFLLYHFNSAACTKALEDQSEMLGLPASFPTEAPAMVAQSNDPTMQPLPSETTLYLFESPKCPYSRGFQETWDRLVAEYPQIDAIKIDTSDPAQQRIILYYNVTLVPTIILVSQNAIQEYSGNRSLDDLRAFLDQRI